jgi:hypothetical protein
MATAVGAFNNQLLAFVEELAETYPEESQLRTAVDALRGLKKANPKLLHSAFMEYVYPDFHGPVLAEDEVTIIERAKTILNSPQSQYAFAYLIFDKYWSTMSEANKQSIWNWCKVLVVLAKRAGGD